MDFDLNKIDIISRTPLTDIHEFVKYCSYFVAKYSHDKVTLKDGRVIVFHHSSESTRGLNNCYYFHEIFEDFLEQYIMILQHYTCEKPAHEMFEELGYEEEPYREDMITYRYKEFPNYHIDISMKNGTFIKEDDYDLAYYITLKELQAINKQIEELRVEQ